LKDAVRLPRPLRGRTPLLGSAIRASGAMQHARRQSLASSHPWICSVRHPATAPALL